MRIACLSAHPHLVDALAAAHVAAFGALEPGWDVAAAAAELRMHRADGLPTTLLALEAGGDWLGSVSLLHEDHPRIPQYTPWLASLYVQPQARGTGLGALLVARAVARAGALGHAHLHLYCTDDLRAYYAGRGWETIDRIDLGVLQVWVMRIGCTGTQNDGCGTPGIPGDAAETDAAGPDPVANAHMFQTAGIPPGPRCGRTR